MNDQPGTASNTSIPTTPAPPGRRRRRWKLWLSLAIAVPVVALLVYLFAGHMALRAEIARIRAEGYPVSLADLNRWYAVPPGHNPADDYVAAFKMVTDESQADLKNDQFIGEHTVMPDQPLTPEGRAAMAKWTSQNHAAIDRLLAIPTSPARYPVDFPVGLERLLGPPYGVGLNRSTGLLGDDAIILADRGVADAAMERVLGILRMADSLLGEPMEMAAVERLSLEEEAVLVLEQVLARSRPSPDALGRVAAALRKAQGQARSPSAWIGERVLMMDGFDLVNGRTARSGRSGGTIISMLALTDHDELAILKVMRALIDDAEKPSHATDRAIDAATRAALGQRLALLSNIDVPAIPRQKLEQEETLLSLGRAAIACRLFTMAEGRPPASLEACVPRYLDRVPLAATDNKPVRLKRTASGLLLWGAGIDGVDHGGAILNTHGRREPKGADVTFILADTPPAHQ